MATDKEIWVVVEQDESSLHDVTLEMLGEGSKLASKLGGRLCAVLMGNGVSEFSEILAHYGAVKVYLMEHPLLAKYTSDAYTSALTDLIKEHTPALIMLGATPNGKDLAQRIAAHLKVGLANECVKIKIGEKDSLEMACPTHGGKIYTSFVYTSDNPRILTIPPGSIGVGKPKKSLKAEIINVNVQIDSSEIRTKVVGFIKADPKTIDITESEIVVAGGRGVGDHARWHIIEELAETVGGSVGATRASCDLGCVTDSRLIGVTGKTIKPKLYIGVGISGASEHVSGMNDAKLIVAINRDRGAPIFKLADVGIVGDASEVVPALIKRIHDEKAKKMEENMHEKA